MKVSPFSDSCLWNETCMRMQVTTSFIGSY